MRNHSPSRNQPTTTSSKLKQPATNFHHAPLQQLATNKHYNLNQRTNQLEAKLIQHHNQRTNQLEADTAPQPTNKPARS